jgi:uncharacterized protein YbjT (DUF2867 family)
MILVTGATGTLGSTLVPFLAEAGLQVRVLARDAGTARKLADVEVVSGDARDPVSLERAVAETQAVVSAMTGFAGKGGVNPQTVDGEGNGHLIQAARRAGVEHFVLVSIRGAAREHPMELYRMKHRAEEELVASGLAWTVLRPTVYMETWGRLIGEPVVRKGKTRVFGRGNNPINFVSVRDVAQFVELALCDDAMRGQAMEVGGPENLTMNQLVEAFEAAAGRPAKVSHVPVPMMRLVSKLLKRFNPTLVRFAQAGLLMDTSDMSFDASDMHQRFPSIAQTTLGDFVRRDFIRGEGRDQDSLS